uniref:Putative secreted protein n=1 Tax=Anopheles triannulatus TaxID=58253 RepID=A0A2M4B4R7_9DIPT
MRPNERTLSVILGMMRWCLFLCSSDGHRDHIFTCFYLARGSGSLLVIDGKRFGELYVCMYMLSSTGCPGNSSGLIV